MQEFEKMLPTMENGWVTFLGVEFSGSIVSEPDKDVKNAKGSVKSELKTEKIVLTLSYYKIFIQGLQSTSHKLKTSSPFFHDHKSRGTCKVCEIGQRLPNGSTREKRNSELCDEIFGL